MDKALPDLDDNARERLAVDRFLTQISDPQLAFGVRQKEPKTIDAAVAATLELQAHLNLANAAGARTGAFPVDAIHHGRRPVQQDRTAELLEQLVTRMEKLQTDLSTQNQQRPALM